MKTLLISSFLAPLALAASVAHAADVQNLEPVAAAGASGGVRIGTLTCDIGGGVGYVLGSSKEVACTFRSTNGETDNYAGAIRKMGVDIGFTTQGKLVWAVFAPTAGYHNGSLAGIYEGATAEATVGFGVGANILIGGTSGSIHLQTISVTGQIGLNLAATGTSMTLTSVN